MPLEKGHLIGGKYRIDRLLGSGGGGVVYVAFNVALEKRVALKILSDGTATEIAARRLVLEGIAASRVRHPAIVEVFDAGEHEGSPWLAMELLEGEPLAARMRRAPRMTAAEVTRLGIALAEGLAAAHDAGVVHRDLKPDNVFLCRVADGAMRPKILDFGLARLRSDALERLTQDGAVLGTLRYMSPEQAAGAADVDGRADLYALGVVLFEALTSEHPHEGDTMAARFARLQVAPARDPRALAPDAPEALVRVIEDCLATSPRARPADAHEVSARLGGAPHAPRVDDATGATEDSGGVLPSPTTPFVGRLEDLAALEERFAAGARLVTLLGPGGTGKTRLALRFAERHSREARPRGGVWFCDLSAARSRSELVALVAATLRVPLSLGGSDPVDQIAGALVSRGHLLVVLDNFEHLQPHALETVGAWLAAAPEARFLATSREPLRVTAEERAPLEPLSMAEARELFTSRARVARAGFSLCDADAATLDEILARLDGMPLAIELAAARLSVLSLPQLAARLSERWKLLAGGPPGQPERQRTMRATIDWSWDLLAAWEKSALAQGAVFRGGFDLEAFEGVVDLAEHDAAPWHVDVLQALRDQSLVWARELPAPLAGLRFGLYEAIREYAIEKLSPAPMEATRARHTAHFLGHGERLAALAHGERAADARRRLLLDDANLRAVAERGLAADIPGDAACALFALEPVLAGRAPADLLALVERLVAHPGAARLSPAIEARVLVLRAGLRVLRGDLDLVGADLDRAASLGGPLELAVRVALGRAALLDAQGNFDEAARVATDAVAAARAFDDRRPLAEALDQLSSIKNHQSRLDEARARSEESLAIAEEIGARPLVGISCGSLGKHAVHQQRRGDAVGYYTRALAIARELDDRFAEARHSNNLAIIYHEDRRHALAREHYERSLLLLTELGRRAFQAIALGNLGILEEEHDLSRAHARFGDARRILEEVGDPRLWGWCTAWCAAIDAQRGDLSLAREGFAKARALLEPLTERAILGVVQVLEGHLDVASGETDAAFARLAAAGEALSEKSEDVRFAMRSLERRLL